MGIGIYELIVLFMLIGILTLPFWIFAVIDILKSEFRGNGKIVWLLVVTLLSIPGIIVYRVVGRKQKINAK